MGILFQSIISKWLPLALSAVFVTLNIALLFFSETVSADWSLPTPLLSPLCITPSYQWLGSKGMALALSIVCLVMHGVFLATFAAAGGHSTDNINCKCFGVALGVGFSLISLPLPHS
jgi:hypothetical protein